MRRIEKKKGSYRSEAGEMGQNSKDRGTRFLGGGKWITD